MPYERALAAVRELKSALKSLPAALWADQELDEAGLILDGLGDRFVRPVVPWVIAVCGPTGAGKSHLVNFLAGGPVSPSGYCRPCTTSPVVLGSEDRLAELSGGGFLPKYRQAEKGQVVFRETEPAAMGQLYLAPIVAPPWSWPEEMILIDTPDFDSVRLENKTQSLDMARRADALILVTHQAKYADQSTWDFLAAEARGGRPLKVVLNRVTATASRDDFQARLAAFGLEEAAVAWPEETSVGLVAVNIARQELIAWLTSLAGRGRELTAASGRRQTARLAELVLGLLEPRLREHEESLSGALDQIRRITADWKKLAWDRVAFHLPEEAKGSILKGLAEILRPFDIWDKPLRLLSRPSKFLKDRLKSWFGPGEGQAEKQLDDRLLEAGREALMIAVREQARALAEAAGRASPQKGLDFAPEEISQLYGEMAAGQDAWLKEQIDKLLSGLHSGKKAALFLVQAMHLGVVVVLVVKTGAVLGTETLVGGALGPLISKLTRALFSQKDLAELEKRAAERHHRELANIFEDQGRRYQNLLAGELAALGPGRRLKADLAVIEEEAGRLWP